MNIELFPKYEQQYRTPYRRKHCIVCTECDQELKAYCIKHNQPLRGHIEISCGIKLCQQRFPTYYSQYPNGCNYCQHWQSLGIQPFEPETPLKEPLNEHDDNIMNSDDDKDNLKDLLKDDSIRQCIIDIVATIDCEETINITNKF